MAATMTPMRLVDLLNEVFQCFDDLVEKYDLEKIKTIGDCYMVAAGVPRSCSDHARVIVNLALDMRAAVTGRKFGDRQLGFRIGINSGPVVAGVIGRKLVALFDHLVGAQPTIPPSMGGIVWTGKHRTLQPRLAAT